MTLARRIGDFLVRLAALGLALLAVALVLGGAVALLSVVE